MSQRAHLQSRRPEPNQTPDTTRQTPTNNQTQLQHEPAPQQEPETFLAAYARSLTEAEVAAATRTYGSSVDFADVRMRRDSLLSSGSSKTIGNTMHLRSEESGVVFEPDGSLTERGMELLIHELGHVWQYQTDGLGYIGSSLVAQVQSLVTNSNRAGAYNWRAAASEPFQEWNPEQQASAFTDHHRLQRDLERDGTLNPRRRAELTFLEPLIAQLKAGELKVTSGERERSGFSRK